MEESPDIDEGLLKVEKELDETLSRKSPSTRLFRGIIIKTSIALAILFLFLLGLFQFSHLNAPDVPRKFLIQTCFLSSESVCRFNVNGTTASFRLLSDRLILQNVEFSFCKGKPLIYNNTAIINNCSISPISNSKTIRIVVQTPDSTFSKKLDGKLVQMIEYTKLARLFDK